MSYKIIIINDSDNSDLEKKFNSSIEKNKELMLENYQVVIRGSGSSQWHEIIMFYKIIPKYIL